MPDVDLTYKVGTCSVAVGATSVIGVGTLWAQTANVRQWDLISIAGGPLTPIVAGAGDDTHITIPAWTGTAKVAVTYVIYQVSPLRFVGGQAMADVDSMLARLNTDGWYRYVNPIYADPTAAGLTANEGQLALKYTTGQVWIMTGGAWVFVTSLSGGASLATANTFTNATEATSASVASQMFAGGVGIAKKLFVTGAVAFASTLAVGGTSTLTGRVSVGGTSVSTDKLQVVTPIGGGLTSLGLFQTGIGWWSIGMASGDGGFNIANNGEVGTVTPRLTINGISGAVAIPGTLSVTGATTIGPGGTAAFGIGNLVLNGSSAANGGSRIDFLRAGTVGWYFGNDSVIVGNANNDFSLHRAGLGNALYVSYTDRSVSLASTAASTSTTTGALTVAGGLGVGGSIYGGANLGFHPAASVTPATNGDVVFQATSNTSFTIKYKGSDGVVRSGSITLA